MLTDKVVQSHDIPSVSTYPPLTGDSVAVAAAVAVVNGCVFLP